MTDLDVLRGIAERNRRYGKYLPGGFPLPCIHRGEPTGATVGCPSCRGTVALKLFACAVHGTCTLGKRVDGHGCCDAACVEREQPT